MRIVILKKISNHHLSVNMNLTPVWRSHKWFFPLEFQGKIYAFLFSPHQSEIDKEATGKYELSTGAESSVLFWFTYTHIVFCVHVSHL
jgi:hypothetical protein